MTDAALQEDASALFEALPGAVRDELALLLVAVGRDALSAQRALVARRTGRLATALDMTVALQMLRVRVGLTDLKNRRDLWYGVIVETGRTAGAKMVERRRREPAGLGKKSRRYAGAVQRYLLRWTAQPARPFVHIEDQVDGMLDDALDAFWQRAAERAHGVAQ